MVAVGSCASGYAYYNAIIAVGPVRSDRPNACRVMDPSSWQLMIYISKKCYMKHKVLNLVKLSFLYLICYFYLYLLVKFFVCAYTMFWSCIVLCLYNVT